MAYYVGVAYPIEIGGVFLIWVILYRSGIKRAGGPNILKPTNLNVHFNLKTLSTF